MANINTLAPIGVPAVKLGETNGWYAGDIYKDYDERKFKVCPKSLKLLKADGKYVMWKPSAKTPMVGAVVEFHGGKAVWTGEGSTSYGVGIWNKKVPKTYEEVVERFHAQNPKTKKHLFDYEFVLLSTPNDRVEYRVVPSVFYYAVQTTPFNPNGNIKGPYTMPIEDLLKEEEEQREMDELIERNPIYANYSYRREWVQYGVVIETWVWWAGRIPIRTNKGFQQVKLPFHEEYFYTQQPTNWIGLREFRNIALNTPPRAFNEVETAVRNKHNDIKEELAAAVFHPTRMMRMMATYGEDWEEHI